MAQAPQKKPAEPPPLEEGSFGMDSAPKDGRWIEATNDGNVWRRVRWYESRVRAPGSIAWIKASCWSTSEPSKLAHRLDNPKAWRPC